MIRVLHAVRSFSPASETFIYDLLRNLDVEGGVESTVVTSRRINRNGRPFEPVWLLPSYATVAHRTGGGPLKAAARAGIREFYAPILKQRIGRLAPHLIHCHFGWSAVALFRLLGSQRTTPFLVSLHGTDLTYLPDRDPAYFSDLLALASAANVRFTVNSEFLADLAVRRGLPSERLTVQYPGVDVTRFRERAATFERPGELRIINVARFVGWKGQRFLIEAFARLRKDAYPNATLTLIGDGTTLPEARRLARNLGVGEHTHFLGEVAHDQIPRLLADAHVYVQPSIIDPTTGQLETFGLAVLEAIAAGLPVVVTNTGGLPEVVRSERHEGQFYWRVPPADADALARTLGEIAGAGYTFRDNSDYSQERLRLFSAQTQARLLLSCYRSLMLHG